MGVFFLRKSLPRLFIKTFLVITIALILIYFCLSFCLRPSQQSHYRIYFYPYYLQATLNESLVGADKATILAFLESHPDEPLNQAQVLTRNELLTPHTAQAFGMELDDGLRFQLLQGLPFIGGDFSYRQLNEKSSSFFPLLKDLLDDDDEPVVNHSKKKKKSSYRSPYVRVFNSAQFCTINEFIAYIYHWSYAKTEPNFAQSQSTAPFVIIPIEKTPHVLIIRPSMNLVFQISTQSYILASALSLLILAACVFLLIFPLLTSLQRIADTCHKVCKGDYTARCDATGYNVLCDLSNNVDEMTSAIERHFSQQKSLLQAVSHELRTPLSRIRFAIEMLDIDENDEKATSRLMSIDEDLSEIDNLIRELSYFNYVDSGKGCKQFESSAIKDLIELTLHQRSHDFKSLEIKTEGLCPQLMVEADPTAFKRVIGNLLSNAARYAQTTILIDIRHDETTNETIVSVEDDGPGIPEDKRKTVFEPFYCLDASRSRAKNGFGLGLAIAHRIMKIHNGSIEVESSSLGGAKMVTRWPHQHQA